MRNFKTDKTVYTVEIKDLEEMKEVKGTFKELHIYFGNTLFIGAKNNKKICIEPKSIQSLIHNVNSSYKETKDKFFRSISLKV